MTDSKAVPNMHARLAELESHVAHLEASHQDMSDMITRQWAEIDKLIRTVKLLHDQLQDVQPAAEARKPPHY